ncbi:MAG: AraC family transcriptional regulator [Lachnospiraceae bacterium]
MKLKYKYALTKGSCDIRYTSNDISKCLNFHLDAMGHYIACDGYFTEREGLNTYLLFYTLAGQGYLKYHEKEYDLTNNTIIMIHCQDKQFYKTVDKSLWDFKFIHFYGDVADKYYSFINDQDIRIISMSNPIRVNELFSELWKLAQKGSAVHDVKISNVMENIFAEVLIDRINPRKWSQYSQHEEAMLRIVEYMRQNYFESVTVEKLAASLPMSKYYFIRAFKAINGVTPHEYLKCIRINESKKFLKNTNLSMNQISDKVGYSNVNIFIKNFKQSVGVTPLKYRKMSF